MKSFKNILVTGGSGFIGSNFIKIILDQSYYQNEIINIVNLDKLTYAASLKNNNSYVKDTRYKFVEGDICDEKLIKTLLKKFNIDAVINFAAESHVDNSIENPNDFIQTNINGTFNLLRCINEFNTLNNKNTLLLHISTDEVFGSLKLTDASFTEKNPYRPNSPYSATKASSDHLVRAWHKTSNLPVIITNCSNNYGPYQNCEKLIPKVISNAFSKEKITIYGDGTNIRDWLYVEDHCKALIKVLIGGKIGETYNIGGLTEKSNIEIATIICEIFEEIYPFKDNISINKSCSSYKDLITHIEDRPGHDFRYSMDTAKIKNDLNWSPNETFDSGIRKTVLWYLKKFNDSH